MSTTKYQLIWMEEIINVASQMKPKRPEIIDSLQKSFGGKWAGSGYFRIVNVLSRRGKLSNCSEFVKAPRNDVSGGALISKTDVLLVRTSLREASLNVHCFSMISLATWQSALEYVIVRSLP
jgi:hypothetical protein